MRQRGFWALPAIVGIAFAAASAGRTGVALLAEHDAAASTESAARESSPRESAAPVDPWSETEVRRLARRAYVWAWPMVYMHNCRETLDRLWYPARCGGIPVAPLNQLCMLTDYITPKQTVVPCPNQDVVYGFGMLDLGREPVVVQVPDFGDRFWVYQLGDQRTDGFANVGKMYDTAPGQYLIVGPDWQGAKPDGIAAVFRCPTRYGYCLPRVFLEDSAADRQALLPLLNRIMVYPLSRFDGRAKSTDWKKSGWLPKLYAGGGRENRCVKPETFFECLAYVLDDVPPLPGEESFYAQLRALLTKANEEGRIKQLLTEMAQATESEVVAPMFEFRNFGTRLAHHWTTIDNGAAFGTDYVTRTAVARSNVFVNRNRETKYFYQDFDAEGLPLDGSKSYRLTFAAGALPPTTGFWSLTLYDENHALYQNELGRYALGTKDKRMRANADGSLTIVVQHAPPAAEDAANWLPAPQGRFSLYLRAYGPKPEVLAGDWQPPPVVPVRERAEAE